MSLRTRVLAGLGLVAVVLLSVALMITQTTRGHLVAQVDAQLTQAADGIHGDSWDRPGPGGGTAPDRFSDVYEGVLTSTGTLQTYARPNFSSTAVPVVDVTAARAAADDRKPFTVGSTGSADHFRMVASLQRDGSVVLLGLPLTAVDSTLGRLMWVELGGTLAILSVLALVGWWVVHLGVRPVNEMADTASAIATGELSQRLPESTPGTEAGRLAIALNQMLGRIEEAFRERAGSQERLRQFVADASHELRTPITTIRGYAELYRSGGLTRDEDLREAMRRTEQESMRMARLVEDMLLLAKLDQGRPLAVQPVDLASLVRDAAADARAVAPDRPITCVAEGPVLITADEDRVRQVLANVVHNALVHTPSTEAVELGVSWDGDCAVVEVVDHGEGMAPEVAARVTERFFRADVSRSRHRGGSGLGLAIVDATLVAHGGEVQIDSAPGRGTTVRLVFPATQPLLVDPAWPAPSILQ